jgi:hypothetical protein
MQGLLQAPQSQITQPFASLAGTAAAQAAPPLSKLHQHPPRSRLHTYCKVPRSERTGTSGDPSMAPTGTAERRANGSDGNRFAPAAAIIPSCIDPLLQARCLH